MVSPHLVKKKEGKFNLNASVKKLFQLIYIKQNKSDDSDAESKIMVSTMVSRLAFFYEKIRNAVDYEDDHLLRKNAIKRIFKRQVVIEGLVKSAESKEMAIHLLTELIQAGYLENNTIPEKKIYEVAEILEKYVKLQYYCFKKENFSLYEVFFRKKKKKKQDKKIEKKLSNWIIALAAAEIEENLTKDEVEDEIVSEMFDILKTNIKLPRDLPFEKDLDLQIYLGIARNFLNFDQDSLNYTIFKYYNKDWGSLEHKKNDEEIEALSKKIDVLYLTIEEQLKHPLKKQLDKIIKSYSLYFSILREIIENNPLKAYDQVINNHKSFINLVKETCEKRYRRIKNKLWKAGLRSIIYIFLTKSIFVFLIEIPAVKWFGEEINIFSLAINIAFPAFFLFMMILFTWSPAQENTKKIVAGVEEVVFSEKRRSHAILLRKPARRSWVMDLIFNLIYISGFFITIYFTIKALDFIGFNWVSIVIFLFFLAFASFFSFRIKRDIKKFIIIEPREGVIRSLVDFFYTPIVAAGKFLSDNASKINVFVFILDFIIEAPFKVFVEIFDDWLKYMKERKDDLVN